MEPLYNLLKGDHFVLLIYIHMLTPFLHSKQTTMFSLLTNALEKEHSRGRYRLFS